MPERFCEDREFFPARTEFRGKVEGLSGLKAEIEAMLSIIENSGGDVEKAAEAERRMIEEWRQMGNEVLHRLGAASAAKEGRRT